MNYEQLFMVLSFFGVFFFGTLVGGLIASRFGIYLRVSKKEDYEAKVKELETMNTRSTSKSSLSKETNLSA